MNLELSGHSTALYSTYWFLEPLGVLFDCGDGAASFLQQKGRKVKHIVCSHPDRDHLAGLLQFLQVNSRAGFPKIYFPKDSGSFPALRDFIEKFDPHKAGYCEWIELSSDSRIELKPNWFLECYPNRHIPHYDGEADAGVKSLSYSLVNHRKKLKAQYRDLPGPEIGQLIKDIGSNEVHDTVLETALTYSADTPIEKPDYWRNPRILIHEATFLCAETASSRGQDVRHSVLDDVIAMATEIEALEKLVLGHFSCRYYKEEIHQAIIESALKHSLSIPVYAVCPGDTVSQLLSSEPVFSPKH